MHLNFSYSCVFKSFIVFQQKNLTKWKKCLFVLHEKTVECPLKPHYSHMNTCHMTRHSTRRRKQKTSVHM